MVNITEGLMEVFFFRPTPFCKDGYKKEMDELLVEMGWEASGMMGMTWKERLSPEEFVDTLSFIEAYAKVYEREVKNPLADIPLTLQEFLNFIEEEKKRIGYKEIVSIEEVIKMLTEKEFKLAE